MIISDIFANVITEGEKKRGKKREKGYKKRYLVPELEEIKEALAHKTELSKTGKWTLDNAQEWKEKLPPAYWFYKIGEQLDLKTPYEDLSQKTFNKEAIQQSKNLKVKWHKVKNHSGILGNDCADSITNAAFFSGWYLPPCVSEHFLLADGGVVSGNSRHFIRCYRSGMANSVPVTLCSYVVVNVNSFPGIARLEAH
ncbi:hypothetical protein G9A89_015897 [Geosiphon pyriformis]|nr:hypothetical protein G9A89_015897 [Geosiphon pyriformis]